jgi:Tol biopolymer transport system component
LSPASCNGAIVYTQNVKQSFSIWRADLKGGTPQELDPGPSAGEPVCTPDGKLVIYDRTEGNEYRLMRVPLAGGTPRKLNDLNLVLPAVSPDGRQVAAFYFKEPGSVPKLAVMPSEGGAPTQVIDMPNNLDYRFPTTAGFGWTADGCSIIYPVHENGLSNLWVQPLRASQGKPAPLRQWTHFSANGVYRFAISPDGKQVVLGRDASTTDIVLITHLS